MKISFEVPAEFREDLGKGASRRLRKSGKVPAILYGGHREPKAMLVDHTRLLLLLENEKFYSTIVNLKVGDQTQAAILKDIQRHPAKNQVLHIDLQRVLDNEKIRLRIPIHFRNEAASVGIKTQGGVMMHLLSDVEVQCLPKDLPEFLELDVIDLELNKSMHLSDIKLPEGVTLTPLLHGRNESVVAIHAPRAEEVEVVVAAAEAAPVEGAAAAAPAGAPGAPGAAPAAAGDAKKGDAAAAAKPADAKAAAAPAAKKEGGKK
ncbi:MAG TPA: 50S ribosomal protein L25/general stress protein Ctc [Steroidobacteraceae bacterium]|nr:50S ribosomal protein L25/general stress protein Ctc [Steroidobacteraceae bacterium]